MTTLEKVEKYVQIRKLWLEAEYQKAERGSPLSFAICGELNGLIGVDAVCKGFPFMVMDNLNYISKD